MLSCIKNNPFRILGVLSNSPLRERVGNQNRLAAFARVGREVVLPYDFSEIIGEKPVRTVESIASANASINLGKDQLKYALFWFINGSPIDGIAIKHLQTGNIDKAKEIFEKQETFSSLINTGILALLNDDITTGFNRISKVIHDNTHQAKLLETLGLTNLIISEEELAELYISELLKEVSPTELLSASSHAADKAIIGKIALDEPISKINAAISAAKSADNKNADAQLEAGTKLMNSTKDALQQIRDIAGATSSQYQMAADNLAKQILQCGINYYNNAPDEDVESPRKAIVLQEYALNIAVGKLTKARCQNNYDILKEAVDNMPPASVAIEARKVNAELRKFCQLPDKISHSVDLLNNTKPLLQTIKAKLGAGNSFYLSLSTQVVGNALHNLIAEVNRAQNTTGGLLDTIKPVVRAAWQATCLMDSFDMESAFKNNRYNPNRNALKQLCNNLGISTSPTSTTTTRTPSGSSPRPTSTTTTRTPSNPPSSDGLPSGCWVAIIIGIIIFLANVLG